MKGNSVRHKGYFGSETKPAQDTILFSILVCESVAIFHELGWMFMDRDAFEISDIIRPRGPFGRTSVYQAIKDGRLVARKFGRKTVILKEDWEAFLRGLPAINGNKQLTKPD